MATYAVIKEQSNQVLETFATGLSRENAINRMIGIAQGMNATGSKVDLPKDENDVALYGFDGENIFWLIARVDAEPDTILCLECQLQYGDDMDVNDPRCPNCNSDNWTYL